MPINVNTPHLSDLIEQIEEHLVEVLDDPEEGVKAYLTEKGVRLVIQDRVHVRITVDC